MPAATENRGLPCPQCGHGKSTVIDSRVQKFTHTDGQVDGPARRRRHECSRCQQRFTTYETVYKGSPNEVEEFIGKVVHHREAFGVKSEPGRSAYEAMAATA